MEVTSWKWTKIKQGSQGESLSCHFVFSKLYIFSGSWKVFPDFPECLFHFKDACDYIGPTWII